MHYVYILRSERDKMLYVGCTSNLGVRLEKHNKGLVPSTSKRVPLDIIFYEAFINQQDAYAREKWLKSGWGRFHVKKMLSNYLQNLGG